MDGMSARARWLDAPPAAWDALVASDPSSTAAQRPETWGAFVATLPGFTLRWLVVEEDGAPIGGGPVIVQRRGGLHWLHVLPHMLPGAPVALAGRHAAVDEVFAQALAVEAAERRVVGGAWSLYRCPGPVVDERAFAQVPGETRWVETSIHELGRGLEAIRRAMDRKQRNALLSRRLVALAFAEAPDRLEEAYALHVAQGRRWPGFRPLPLELMRRLLAAGGERPVARLFTLSDAAGVVSAAFTLDGSHETFVWWTGTHPEGRRLGASALAFWRVADWAAASGRARVNLGASTGLDGVASFKHGLGAIPFRYPVRWLDARHAPWQGRVAGWLQERVRRGRPRGASA
jgi:CelD/BcsL family acetyltransferase involved in cellulose biosynthesis